MIVEPVFAIAACAATLGIEGTAFTIDGRPTFLIGASYYGGLGASPDALRRDLDDLGSRGFNWIRVWATWAAEGFDVSAVDARGEAREPFLGRLLGLVEEADRRGIVVDVTLARQNGEPAAPGSLPSQEAHLRAVRTLARALKPLRNLSIDLANERNVRDRRFVSIDELAALREAIRAIDPERLVTASHAGGEIAREDVEAYLRAGLDFLAPHRPRDPGSPGRTREMTGRILEWARGSGRPVPVHYQEPFRRDYGAWEPSAIDFLVDARGAREGGAAGWCLHNGSPRRGSEGPARSFDLRARRLFDQLDPVERFVADHVAAAALASSRTWVALVEGRWYLDGRIAYPGARAEGLLLNARMINAVFEDRNPATCPKGFDPDANTDAFIRAIPEYVAHGIRAFTIGLQGGMPGYEGAANSAFTPEGDLRPSYMARVRRAIEAADAAGAAVILSCFYQRQDQILRDEDAVRAGVRNVARWIRESGFGHVILEIANEYPHGGFDHGIIRRPDGIASLIRLARETAPGLYVSASGMGDGTAHDEVARAADFVTIHFNATPVERIPERVAALRRHGKAIVCNEDDKRGEEAARAAEASVAAGCSYGLMLKETNQYVPFEFRGAADDPVLYAKLRELASAEARRGS